MSRGDGAGKSELLGDGVFGELEFGMFSGKGMRGLSGDGNV